MMTADQDKDLEAELERLRALVARLYARIEELTRQPQPTLQRAYWTK